MNKMLIVILTEEKCWSEAETLDSSEFCFLEKQNWRGEKSIKKIIPKDNKWNMLLVC
jgi:hypothetical protein